MSGEKPLPIPRTRSSRRPGATSSHPRAPARSDRGRGIGDDLKASDLYSPDVRKSTLSTGTSGSVYAEPGIVTLGGVDAGLPERGIMTGSLPVAPGQGARRGSRSARCSGTSEISGRYRELGV